MGPRELPGSSAPTNALVNLAGQHEVNEAASSAVTDRVVKVITERFAASKNPAVLVDACADRFGVGPTVRKLVETCGIRFYTSE